MSTLNFDHYSEEALLVLWHTRQAVSEVGGSTITPEHLLIGFVRSNPELVRRFLIPPDAPDAVSAEVADAIRASDQIPPTTADLPLAEDTDRILLRAIQESEDDRKEFVLPAHILLALLNDSATVAAAILRNHGVSATEVRSYLHNQR
jgi:ATP-dependent Clp protease ATP-binding subunit ClpA